MKYSATIKVWTLVSALLCFSWCAHGASLRFGDPSPPDDDGVMSVPVYFEAGAGESVASLQFGIALESRGIEIVGVEPGSVALNAGKDVSLSTRSRNPQVIVVGMNINVMATGEIARLLIRRTALSSQDSAISLRNTIMSGPYGETVRTKVDNPSVTVPKHVPEDAGNPKELEDKSDGLDEEPADEEVTEGNGRSNGISGFVDPQRRSRGVREARLRRRVIESRVALRNRGVPEGSIVQGSRASSGIKAAQPLRVAQRPASDVIYDTDIVRNVLSPRSVGSGSTANATGPDAAFSSRGDGAVPPVSIRPPGVTVVTGRRVSAWPFLVAVGMIVVAWWMIRRRVLGDRDRRLEK